MPAVYAGPAGAERASLPFSRTAQYEPIPLWNCFGKLICPEHRLAKGTTTDFPAALQIARMSAKSVDSRPKASGCLHASQSTCHHGSASSNPSRHRQEAEALPEVRHARQPPPAVQGVPQEAEGVAERSESYSAASPKRPVFSRIRENSDVGRGRQLRSL